MYIPDFEKTKTDNAQLQLRELCSNCNGKNTICGICPVFDSFNIIYSLSLEKSVFDFEKPDISENVSVIELIFEKNQILLANNAFEEICSDCSQIAISCLECPIHEIKRNIASLPVREPVNTHLKKGEKTTCGTSCSSGKCK